MRKYGFYYRYDTDEERAALNRLWRLVNDRLNYLTPTIKPIGYGSARDGQRRRLYDEPQTPLDRLLAAGVLSPAQESELLAYRDSLNPAAIGRQIADLQAALLRLANGQDRAALPRRHTPHLARRQIRDTHQEQSRQLTRFRGHSLRDAWIRFRGHLDLTAPRRRSAVSPAEQGEIGGVSLGLMADS